jgi:multidrug efflux pump subunit AcrB
MNIAEIAIKNKTITLVFTFLIIGGGIMSYEKLGRLEDPEFTIKEAQVFTLYPGATAKEVADEVTDRLETTIQTMGQLKRVWSISEPGKSTIRVVIQDHYDKKTLPQVWDELRRKVNDVQKDLPPGTSTSVVFDEFGDVYGIFAAVFGDGYSFAELKEYAKAMRRELLLVEGVGKIDLFAEQQETVYVTISRSRLARLGISPDLIYQTLENQNLVVPAGKVEVGQKYIRIQPSGEFRSVKDIGDLLILQQNGQSKIFLKDIATITRGYEDPPTRIMHYNGTPAIGLGISTARGGNVVKMGHALSKRARGLQKQTPIGMEYGPIWVQSDMVDAAISNFMISLVEALAIVIGVLIFAMGFKSALLIGAILLLTVLSTFMLMDMNGVLLERISLGALIIALGMLVDNAIVVIEGILINLQKGMGKVEAAAKIVKQTMWPLFGATLVAILAFAAIGASDDKTGEFCRSLYQVILYSLGMSWVLAITVTPLFGTMFLSAPVQKEGKKADPYGGAFFQRYKKFLEFCLRRRAATNLVVVGLFLLSIYGFGYVNKSFFPQSTSPLFLVHYWLPQGTHIKETEADIQKIEKFIQGLDGVSYVASFVGGGSMRFVLTYAPEEANTAYGMFLVAVEDYKMIEALMPQIEDHVKENYPNAQVFPRKFNLGPGDAQKIQARFRGSDEEILSEMAEGVVDIMRNDPLTRDVVTDWRQRVPLVRPIVAEKQARNAGITRAQIARALQSSFEGLRIGTYREDDELLPIVVRSPKGEMEDVNNLNFVQIWSPAADRSIPLSQVVVGFESQSEFSIIRRRHRLPTLTVKGDPKPEIQASQALGSLMPKIEDYFQRFVEKNQLRGYTLEWGGEYEDSGDAQAAIKRNLPVPIILMILTVIILFNNLRQPLIIWLTVPLALIGVVLGLLTTNQPFGFMALLGFLSLSGMLIKNAIVLIDEINAQLHDGKEPYEAVVGSGVSRLRPVSMAALTTVLGMVPLLADAFFVSMAVTIMFGLTFATVLTLVVVPVLYVTFYKIPSK